MISTVPAKVGPYTLLQSIARGASGEIYLGSTGTSHVAVKVMKIFDEDNEQEEEEVILREIRIAKEINHENVIKLLYHEKNPWYYLVFELCENGDLDTFIHKNFKDKKIPEHQCFKLINQIVAGMKALREKNVVHRDLKLMNLLLDKNYTVKIADFGQSQMTEHSNQLLTTFAGTYMTMAPEMLEKDQKYTAKCDIWSLGVIFYYLLTFTYPYNNKSSFARVLSKEIENITFKDFDGNTWVALVSLVKSMLMIDPEKRLTFEELFQRVDEINNQLYTGLYSDSFKQDSPETFNKWYPITPIFYGRYYYRKVQILNRKFNFSFDRQISIYTQVEEFNLVEDSAIITYADGGRYDGEVRDKLRHGKGTLTMSDGCYYNGEWSNDALNGQGTFLWPDDKCYKGSFVNNIRSGYGELILGDGASYKGGWENNKPHGKGNLMTSDGRNYEGEWVAGQPFKGTLYLPNEEQITGKFVNFLIHDDDAEYVWPSGIKYKGSILEGIITGFGQLELPTGEKYIGEFKEEAINGKGEVILPEGNKFQGTFTTLEFNSFTDFKVKFTSFEGEEYTGWLQNLRMKDRQAYYKWSDGRIYEGPVADGKLDGIGGKLWHLNGEEYEGEWKDNLIHGTGVYTYADGRVYEGNFLEGKPHGIGKMTYANGSSYEGNWEDGLPHGEGKCIMNTGKVYKLQFCAGKQLGTIEEAELPATENHFQEVGYLDGGKYRGMTKDSRRHGKGEYTWPNGDVYRGDFENGERHGYGEMIYANQEIYRGQWKKNSMTGNGESIWPSGKRYIGEFVKNEKTGFGILYEKEMIYKGYFQNGKRHGVGELIYPDQTIYKGKWEDGGLSFGERFNKDGRYEGDFLNLQPHGKGEMEYTNGDVYKGEWKEGKRHGKGTLKHVDGSQFEGKWTDDRPHGMGKESIDGHEFNVYWKNGSKKLTFLSDDF